MLKNITLCLVGLILSFRVNYNMKQEIKRIGLFVILPLLLTTLALLYVGDAEGFESEEKTVHALVLSIEPVSSEEPRITPIIGIIGVEQ